MSPRWPSKNHRDYQTRRRAHSPRSLAEHVIARGQAESGVVHVVDLRIVQGPRAEERIWRLSLPLN